jgi:hypothetical protein
MQLCLKKTSEGSCFKLSGHTLGLIHPNLSGQLGQLSNGLFDAYAWDIMSWDLVPDPGFYAWEKFILGWITPDPVIKS